MVAITKQPKFDPAAHLTKHGWKGKGTALKHGHATRPLAVVQKKTLSGIGKDRDEAVPFWDHIFAATAASLFSPSPSGSPAPSSSSWAATPVNVDSKGVRLAPAPGDLKVEAKPKLSINATARAGRELARRGLYSRFLRGKVIVNEPESDLEDTTEAESSGTSTPMEVDGQITPTSTKAVEMEAGPSTIRSSTKEKKSKSEGKEREKDGETKEERRTRREEKSRLKAEKQSRQTSPSGGDGERKAQTEVAEVKTSTDKKDKRKKRKAQELDAEVESSVEAESQPVGRLTTDKKDKKRRKDKNDAEGRDDAAGKKEKKKEAKEKRKLTEGKVEGAEKPEGRKKSSKKDRK